jgi:anti-sigma28 factor (negative regulator of flagellin synthesis)
MKNAHPIDQAAADERQARAQWDSLLARLQAVPPADARLMRVRHAIAAGEFHVDARAIAERLLARMLTS